MLLLLLLLLFNGTQAARQVANDVVHRGHVAGIARAELVVVAAEIDGCGAAALGGGLVGGAGVRVGRHRSW